MRPHSRMTLRERVLDSLSQRPATLSDLVARFGAPRNSLSATLTLLFQAGVLRREPASGRNRMYFKNEAAPATPIEVPKTSPSSRCLAQAAPCYRRGLCGWGGWGNWT